MAVSKTFDSVTQAYQQPPRADTAKTCTGCQTTRQRFVNGSLLEASSSAMSADEVRHRTRQPPRPGARNGGPYGPAPRNDEAHHDGRASAGMTGGLGRHRMSSGCPFQPGILRGLEKVTASVTAGNFRPSLDSEPPTKNQSRLQFSSGSLGRIQGLRRRRDPVDCGTRPQASVGGWTALPKDLTHAIRRVDRGLRRASSASERLRCRPRSACAGPAR